MSEYLSKKAVLEHIRREIDIIDQQKDGVSRYRKTFSRGAIRGLQNLEHAIQSGAFDADESEVQRLRAALEWIVECSTDYQSINKARNALHFIKGGEKDD